MKSGINLYYLPSIEERPYLGQLQEFYFDPNSTHDPNSAWNIQLPNQGNPHGIDCYFYDQEVKVWKSAREKKGVKSEWLTANTFNAIDAQRPGIFYINLTALDHPVLYLRGFIDPNYFQKKGLNPCAYLDTNLPDPVYFNTNVYTLEVLNTPGLLTIETIRGQHSNKGSWEASYRFFGRPVGKDICLMPDQVYVIDKKKGR